MAKSKEIVLDIYINTESITSRTNALILISIIRHFSFFRNQIPLAYDTYKSLLNAKLKSAATNPPTDELKTYAVERELKQAEDTLNRLDAVAANIETCDGIKQAAILFGSTITTPREIYQINLAPIDSEMTNEASIQAAMQSLMIRLSTAEELISKPINQTNMFLVVRRPNVEIDPNHLFQPNPAFNLPGRCETRVVLNLRKTKATFCRTISIFNDFGNLSLNDAKPENEDQYLVWYESSVAVKGFKQTFNKGVPVWDMALK